MTEEELAWIEARVKHETSEEAVYAKRLLAALRYSHDEVEELRDQLAAAVDVINAREG